MIYLYSFLFYCAVPFILLRLLVRARKAPAYRHRWAERFALYSQAKKSDVIWFHAVSVGETEAVFPLVEHVLRQYPDHPVLLTTTTPTGSERAKSVLGGQVLHVYLPYDLPGCVGRFFDWFTPALAVIVETEIWPNLYRKCGKASIPLAIINARISERSARGYRKLKSLTAETLENVSLIAAQTDDDASRFRDLGADPQKIIVCGNIKFDYRMPGGLIEQGAEIRRKFYRRKRVWIAASTHEGEDEQILRAFTKVLSSAPDTLLLLVPRHPERFKNVAGLCIRHGFKVKFRSEKQICDLATDVYLVDTLGELKLFYATADVSFVGGSLVATGGHNILEPAAVGLPVIFGPHMFNFKKIAELFLESGAAVQVNGCEALAREVLNCLHDDGYRRELADRAHSIIAHNRGAVHRISEHLDRLLRTARESADEVVR